MWRRRFLATCGIAAFSGCLSGLTRDDRHEPGTVTCANGVQLETSNGPRNGTWPTELHDMRNTGQTDAPGPTGCVDTQWTWTQNRRPFGGVVVADGRSYVGHSSINNTQFVVLNAKTGNPRWKYTTPSKQLLPRATPTFVDKQLYLTNGHTVESVNLQTQSLDWYHDLFDELDTQGLTSPRVANKSVYVGSASGIVFAFNAETGERRWTHNLEGLSDDQISTDVSDNIAQARRQGAVYAPIAVTEKRVYVTSWDFSLSALDAVTGECQWQFSLGSDNLDTMHAPVLVDDTVYTQTENAILYVFDADTGEELWTYDAMGQATDGISPIVDDNSVYIIAGTSTENLFLVALDRHQRSVRWKRQIGPTFANPVADTDTIYLDYANELHAIKKADGAEKWTLRIQGELAAPATVVGSAVYAVDTGGTVYAIW